MKKVTVFVSDDGQTFNNEAACVQHEGKFKFKELIRKYTSINDESVINTLAFWFHKHNAELRNVLASNPSGWVSNIGHSLNCYPDGLEHLPEIEIKTRNGETIVGFPHDWGLNWCETDNHQSNIIAYRILK